MRASPQTTECLRSYYAALDRLELERVGQWLHEDCQIQYADGLAVSGREKILRAMELGLSQLAGIHHTLKAAWEEDDEVIFELEVTYRRRDGRTIVRPGVGIFVIDGERIRGQRLFVDASGVWD